ncbi:hypothetical protein JCM9534A_17800 [Catenuloplanes indicus JCM 9534]
MRHRVNMNRAEQSIAPHRPNRWAPTSSRRARRSSGQVGSSSALTACAATGGASRTPQYIRRVDGRRLWRIDDTVSPQPGWGFGGGPFTAAADLDSDPGLAAALVRCRG